MQIKEDILHQVKTDTADDKRLRGKIIDVVVLLSDSCRVVPSTKSIIKDVSNLEMMKS